MMNKYIKKATDDNENNKGELANLQTQIHGLKDSNSEMSKKKQELLTQISKLEKEKEKYSQDVALANSNMMQMVEEVKLK